MLKFVSLRRNKTHSYDITSRNSNNPLLICRAFHPRTSHSITNTMYRASHHLCEVENYSQLYKKEEWLADSPTVISLQRWGWMPEGQTVSSLLSLLRRAVLMPWLILGADFLAVWQGTWKPAWKKKSTSRWLDTGGKCWFVSLCCYDPEEETTFPVAAVKELQGVHWVHCI